MHVPRHCAGMVDYDWYNPDGEWYCIYQIIPINNQPLLCVLTYIIATQIVGWFSYFIQYLHNLKWYQNDETIEFNVLNKIALKLKRT
ncbi:MAG: hypothetical protein LBB39_03225 [Mycoplasmataceae bacterium]|nr:hypothetical protein [Mycoplasmataceae bacterium]